VNLGYAQNQLYTFPWNFPVDRKVVSNWCHINIHFQSVIYSFIKILNWHNVKIIFIITSSQVKIHPSVLWRYREHQKGNGFEKRLQALLQQFPKMLRLMPLTYTPETATINQLHIFRRWFLVSVPGKSGTGFVWYQIPAPISTLFTRD